jgi:predicted site-specific integrase-resolvase
LKGWARRQGVGYSTARRWFGEGKLPVPARRVGGLILAAGQAAPPPAGITAVYARVPSAGQEPGLDRQVARVTAWAAGEGLAAGRVVTGAGSALNGKRRKFLALLRDEAVTVIVAGHRDRLARFGAGYAGAALGARGRRLLVADPSGADGGLVRDVTGVLTSRCARLHGQRAAGDRAARAAAVAAGEDAG